MDYLKKYNLSISPDDVAAALRPLSHNMDNMITSEILKKCFSMMDLTTLHTNDTENSVLALIKKVNALKDEYPTYPLPASVCVYPDFAALVATSRCTSDLHVTTVAGCFPSSQSFPEVKVLECRLAVRNGADEIDIVLALNHFCAGNFKEAASEIEAIRTAIDEEASTLGRKVILKVILETGLLVSVENIAQASFLAMEAGADFIKTSTGKVDVNATPMAAYVMCRCIDSYYKATGKMVGFKAAGGIADAKDACCYYFIALSVLGEKWLDKEHFRFGVSKLGNSLMSEIEQSFVKYF